MYRKVNNTIMREGKIHESEESTPNREEDGNGSYTTQKIANKIIKQSVIRTSRFY